VAPATEPARSLGPALAVARSVRGAGPWPALHVVAEAGAGDLARRAAGFALPVTVWSVVGTALEPAEPGPLPVDDPVPPGVAPFADLLAAAGADPVVEHGRLVGEVLGLEVARVVVADDGPRLEIGVGRFDREAHAVVSAGVPVEETLARVVALVRRHRVDDAEPHPLGRLAPTRRLRSRLLARPDLVGADHLAPMAPPLEPPDLRAAWPAPAVGTTAGGEPLVVVCSVGVDLDLVPSSVDARLAAGPDHRLVLAVPARDVHPLTVELAAALRDPAEVLGLSEGSTGSAS
jgi:hypothetical protein